MFKRLLFSLFTIFICTLLTFFIIRIIPGDPVQNAARDFQLNEGLSEKAARDRAIAVLNYDPDLGIGEAFIDYFGGLLTGDMGQSLVYREAVSVIVLRTLPWTMAVVVFALSGSAVVGMAMGMRIAWGKKRGAQNFLNIYGSIFGSIPEYIIAYILVSVFAVLLAWFPLKGAYDSRITTPGLTWVFIGSALYHMFLPILTYFITTVGGWALGMRASAASVLGSDYTTYAVARGIPSKKIATSYVGRNSILPMLANLVVTFSLMLGGVGLVEGVFGYPGMGAFMIAAIAARDYALMQGLFLLTAVAVVVSSFLADILYRILDPRVRSLKF